MEISDAMVEAGAKAIVHSDGATWVDVGEEWEREVSNYHRMCAKFPEYAASRSLITSAFRQSRAALEAALPLAAREAEAGATVHWIKWDGGDFLPVPPEMLVTVLLRDGSTEGPAKALEFSGEDSCWKHRGASGDIVAYTSALLFVSPAPHVAEGWRPIETAPKDGSLFLAIARTTSSRPWISQCKFVGPDARYPTAKLDWFMGIDGWPQPTHWMPLPAAPQIKEGEDK